MMKKITLLLILLTTCFGYSQNLINNGAFDNNTGWTIVNHYGTDSTNGSVTFVNGTVKIEKIDPSNSGWIHMGIYTSVYLTAGWYQFDMDMTFDGIDAIWGEVYIGNVMPVQNQDYGGDQQVIEAYNGWNCVKTYSGSAVAAGCDDSSPGKFEITTDGTYYLVFRTGGSVFGASGVVVDNFNLVSATPPPAPVLLTEFNFDFESATPLVGAERAEYNDDATNTITDGINSSVEVGEISKINDSWWSQLQYIHNDGVDLSTGNKGFSIKVKGPRTLPVTIKVEDGGDTAEVTENYTTPNVWQELKFDFSSYTSNTNKKIAVFFDMQVNDDVVTDPNLNIFQIDDFVFGKYSTLSIKNYEIPGLTVYPNPTSSKWRIATSNQEIQSIEVFNVIGKRVLSLKPNTLAVNVDASILSPGVYIATITTERGTSSRKLIKN